MGLEYTADWGSWPAGPPDPMILFVPILNVEFLVDRGGWYSHLCINSNQKVYRKSFNYSATLMLGPSKSISSFSSPLI